MKRTKLIENVFRRFATPYELRTVDELYVSNRKGSASALMQRRVCELLIYFIEKYGVPSKMIRTENVIPSIQREEEPRFIKINYGGNSSYERL